MRAVLRTKFELPPLRGQHVRRERLVQRLVEGVESGAHLALVSAPAGFGKSSLLVEWGRRLREEGAQAAWVALDERDNDPARFAAYLTAALATLGAPFEALRAEGEEIGLHETMLRILNRAAEARGRVALILDDYHLIAEPQIHEAVGYVAAYAPANLALALGTRADPPLQLARLRALGAVTEVRMADLRFRAEETAQWLGAALGRAPSPRTVQRLDAVTEGWAAALALVMLSRPQADEEALDHELARFSLSRRHIFDYFAQEVFERQPERVQAFLLDTCVLEWLQPELCESLTGSAQAGLLLADLAASGLFVTPLSDTAPAYRYHPLFAQFLRQRLEPEGRERLREKDRLAAAWQREHGYVVEAVHHALAAEDLDYAAGLIEERAWAELTSRGEIATILGWLPRFDETTLRARPRLCLYFSRSLYLTGDLKRSERYVRLAAEALEDGKGDNEQQRGLAAIAANYRATLAAVRGDVAEGRAWIAQAAAQADAVGTLDQVRIANTEAYLRLLGGEVAEARAAYETALEKAQGIGHDYLALDAVYYLALIDLWAGEPDAALARCEAALAERTARRGPVCLLLLVQALAHIERNYTVEAEALLREAIALAGRANIPDVSWAAHAALAELLAARRQAAEAEAHVAQARAVTDGYRSPMLASLVGAAEARVRLHLGDADAAARWADGYAGAGESEYARDEEDLTLARVRLAQGDATAALSALERMVDGAQRAGRLRSVMAAEALAAVAYAALGRAQGAPEAAREALGRALALAQPRGVVRPFVQGGPAMVPLLRRAAEDGAAAGYARRVLAQMARAEAAPHPADALTEREVEVLARMAEGASNQDIAEALVVSVGTVKSHVHRIMDKLGARNRTEAVRKARGLGVIAG